MATVQHGAPKTDAQRIAAIVGASSGNLVEWFDFYVYAFCAVYFSSSFFPKGDPSVQLLQSAAIFAIGFLMRPIGGWLFGWIGDKYGRRPSMMISMVMMCGGSLVIACVPNYASIGIWAPAILLLARMLQGLSVGGEYGASATYMSEVAPKGRKGFFASFQYVTLIGGQLLAVMVVFILERVMDHDELRAWGWRIPFFIGAATAVVAFYLRRSLHETVDVNAAKKRKDAGSVVALMKQHPKAFFAVIGFTCGGSLTFYTFTTYMQKYLVNTAGMPLKTVTTVMTVALFCYMCLQPFFGALSDRIGRKKMMMLFGGGFAIFTVPLLTALSTVKDPVAAFALIMCAMVISSFYTSISGLIKAEMFPPEVRALGVGLSYAVANAVFGGSAEFVALWLKSIGMESVFYWYVAAAALVAFLVTFMMRDTRQLGLLKDD